MKTLQDIIDYMEAYKTATDHELVMEAVESILRDEHLPYDKRVIYSLAVFDALSDAMNGE